MDPDASRPLQPWAAALSRRPDLTEAVRECADTLRSSSPSLVPNLLFVFIASEHRRRFNMLHDVLREHMPGSPVILGASSMGILGAGEEQEEGTALSVLACDIDAGITPFQLHAETLPDEDASPGAWHEALGVKPDPTRPAGRDAIVLLADMRFQGLRALFGGLDYAFPGAEVLGGVNCGSSPATDLALFQNEDVGRDQVYGLYLEGDTRIHSTLAQGCRAVGKPGVVTRNMEHIILEIDQQPVMEYLAEMNKRLSPPDRKLTRTSMLLGVKRESDPFQEAEEEYVMRNLLGVDFNTGGLIVGDPMTVGQRVQFHVREAQAARQNLEQAVMGLAPKADRVRGGLLFSCIGRGSQLFGRPHYEIQRIQKELGQAPVAGFFGNGEIMRLNGQTQLYGYSACCGVFQ